MESLNTIIKLTVETKYLFQGDQVVSEVHSKLPDMQYTAWVNALFGRFVWNILTDVQWEKRIRDRIVRSVFCFCYPTLSIVIICTIGLPNA